MKMQSNGTDPLLLSKMVSYLGILFFYLALLNLFFILVGLWRPWVMLWWEDISNRRKVIRVYGVLAIAFYALYWAMKFI